MQNAYKKLWIDTRYQTNSVYICVYTLWVRCPYTYCCIHMDGVRRRMFLLMHSLAGIQQLFGKRETLAYSNETLHVFYALFFCWRCWCCRCCYCLYGATCYTFSCGCLETVTPAPYAWCLCWYCSFSSGSFLLLLLLSLFIVYAISLLFTKIVHVTRITVWLYIIRVSSPFGCIVSWFRQGKHQIDS